MNLNLAREHARRPGRASRSARSIVVAILILAWVVTPGSASATTYLQSGARWTYYSGTAGSDGWTQWDDPSGMLRVESNPGAMTSGWCFDDWFDWHNIAGEGTHFDSRVARSCRANFYRDSGVFYEGVWSYNTDGMQKNAVCYGPNQHVTSSSYGGHCRNGVGAVQNVLDAVIPGLPNYCTEDWVLTSSGVLQYGDGGYTGSCTS
jgi:hypothetical protein